MLTWQTNKVSLTVHSLGNSCMRMSLAVWILATMSLCSASSLLPLQLFTIQCSSMLHNAYAGPAHVVLSIINLPLMICFLAPPHSSLPGPQVSLTFLYLINLASSLSLWMHLIPTTFAFPSTTAYAFLLNFGIISYCTKTDPYWPDVPRTSEKPLLLISKHTFSPTP